MAKKNERSRSDHEQEEQRSKFQRKNKISLDTAEETSAYQIVPAKKHAEDDELSDSDLISYLDSDSEQEVEEEELLSRLLTISWDRTAINEVLKEGFELAREPHPWELNREWKKLRIEALNLNKKKCEVLIQELYLVDERLRKLQKLIRRKAKDLEPPLSEEEDED